MSVGIQAAEQTVRLAVRAGGEIKRVGQPSIAAVANLECPQPVDDDRLPVGVAHLVKKLAAIKIEGVDVAVAEISDPQGASQRTETNRRLRHAPGRVELAVLSESLAKSTIKLEYVHEAMALARYGVVLCRVLLGEGHENCAVEDSDVERGIGIRQVLWIDKCWRRGQSVKIVFIHFHHAAPEIGSIQAGHATCILGDGKSFIDG